MSGWGAAVFSIIFYLCALQVAFMLSAIVYATVPRCRWDLVYWLLIVLSVNIQVLVTH